MLTCAFLFSIFIDANNLVGSIPSEICLLNLVEKIHLSENEFQGKLPACIASMPSLNRFDADMNQLSGSLPTGPWPALESLTLSDNEFSGDLSSVSSSSMPFLRNLDVHNNQFTGGLPEGLFLKAVEKLDFSENQFSGRLYDLFLGLDGKGIFQAASTLLVLRLNDNLFQGDLVGQLFLFLGQLQELTLEGNLLTGSLETECARSLDKLTADCAHVDCSCCTECP
jgi:Leucine-rich repeat (LRR) protein